MQFLKRKIDKYLNEWKEKKKRKPLIVKGARQVGKTESIRKFAKENYNILLKLILYYKNNFKIFLMMDMK